MSNINPNMIGSILQTQVTTQEAAKRADAQRNKRARDSSELARLADMQQHEVEDTDHVEGERVLRGDQQPSHQDTYEHEPSDEEQAEQQENPTPALSEHIKKDLGDDESGHIVDFSV